MNLVASLILAGALVTIAFRRGGRASPVAYFSLYCFFFLFGPALNAVLDQPIYRGTVLSEIDVVIKWYVAALAGLLLSDLLFWRDTAKSPPLGSSYSEGRRKQWMPVTALLAFTGAYGYAMALTVGAGVVTKHAGIAAAGPMHYRYLLTEAIIAAAFWYFRDTRTAFKWYVFNVGGYLLYCLAFQERDFVFVAYAIAVTGVIYKRLTIRWALVTSVAGLYVATELFLARMSQEFTLASLLNQGSNLFVDTFLSSSHRTVLEPLHNTYLRVITGRLPMEGAGTAEWFKGVYAPYSPSGYGFSLIGEARYNLGALGPFLAFFVLGAVLLLAFRGSPTWDPRIVGPATLFAFMYALRGDLRAVVVSMVFIVVIHFLLRLPVANHQQLELNPAAPRRRTRDQ